MSYLVDLNATQYAESRGCGMYHIFELRSSTWIKWGHVRIRNESSNEAKLVKQILHEMIDIDNSDLTEINTLEFDS